MNSIAIEHLKAEGYSEDSQRLTEFERPYLIPKILGISAFVICFTLLMVGSVNGKVGMIKVGMISVPVALLFLLATMLVLHLSRPKSKLTGKPLIKYKNRFPAPSVLLELIYVCPDSKIFFRRVYAMRGNAAAGAVATP
jgi:Zn-dependent membrane protease YugP